MRFGNYVLEGPAKFCAITLAAATVLFGVRYALGSGESPEVVPRVRVVEKEVIVEKPVEVVRADLSVDEFWDTLEQKDRVYLVKMGYASLSEEQREMVARVILPDVLDRRCEGIYKKMCDGLRYTRKRLGIEFEKPDPKNRESNLEQLAKLWEVENETRGNARRLFNFGK